MSDQAPPKDASTKARQGETAGIVRWVLGISLTLVIIGMVVAFLLFWGGRRILLMLVPRATCGVIRSLASVPEVSFASKVMGANTQAQAFEMFGALSRAGIWTMSESYSEGGAGPALAAHSKDGSARGQTSASETTGTPASNETAGQANGTTNNTTSSPYRTARESASVVSERAGQGIEQATQFVRDQPAFTLVLTGFLCLMLGILLGRRWADLSDWQSLPVIAQGALRQRLPDGLV